jgi:hypothetical protein
MKVIDLFEMVGENTNIDLIFSESNEVVSRYDGRNSIDEEYNDKEVISFNPNWITKTLEVIIEL